MSQLQSAHSQLVGNRGRDNFGLSTRICNDLGTARLLDNLETSFVDGTTPIKRKSCLSNPSGMATETNEEQRRKCIMQPQPQPQPQQQQQQREQGAGGIWSDFHKSGTHKNAQCAAQGGTPPPSSFQKRKGKANVAQKTLQSNDCPAASAQLAEYKYDSNGSAFTLSTQSLPNKAFVIDSGASHLMIKFRCLTCHHTHSIASQTDSN
jgi:hypothetical protein